MSTLLGKIRARSAQVCVVGLGYVGIPLSVASAEAGFRVIGVDVDREKVAKANSGICYVEDRYSERRLPSMVKKGKVKATTRLGEASGEADIVIICVPTPLDRKDRPDLHHVRSVARALSRFLGKFKLVILESTSFPGTTEEVLKPLLESGGKIAGKDFALAYSPERIDYGNPRYSVKDIPKVVGGVDSDSTRLGAAFYRAILKAPVLEVSSPAVAEASKILENIFRYVNIAIVNELSVLHEKLGVDFIEAIGAAATKPFGFMPHYPGPGIGGHCIPKDPFYLVYKAKKLGFPLRLVAAASAVNKMMPRYVVDRLFRALRDAGKDPASSTVTVWGLAYKGEVRDTRRSPALEILRLLQATPVTVNVYDPFVPKVTVGGRTYESARSAKESVSGADVLLVATDHGKFRKAPLALLQRSMLANPILYDTRNIFQREKCENAGFTYIAIGRP